MRCHFLFLTLCCLTQSLVNGQWDMLVNQESNRLNLTTTATTGASFGGPGRGAICDMENGKKGVCVEHYQCKDDKVITDGAGLFDDRITSCAAYKTTLVCCLNPDPETTETNPTITTDETTTIADTPTPSGNTPTTIDNTPTTSDNTPATSVNTAATSVNTPATSVNTPATTGNTPAQSTFNTCGWSNIGGLPAVDEEDRIGGQTTESAKYGEFPFLVALIMKQGYPSNLNVFGGGTIIHPSVILTAAHKVSPLKPADILIRAGEYDLQDRENIPNQDRDVDRFIIHEHHERISAYNNIALLILESPLVMGAVISPGCLGRVLPAPGTRCMSMGWGRTPTTTAKSNVLKKITVPLVSKKDCETALRATRFGYIFELHPSLICAGGERNVDTCKGDGGSPLVCSIAPERYAVYGLVSYGIGCGNTNPAVYANIPHLYDWISSKMLELGYGTNDYSYN